MRACPTRRRCSASREAALALAIEWAKQRETFGSKLADKQAIQWMIADSEIELRAARLLVYQAAWKGDLGQDIKVDASICKVYATEIAGKVVDRCIQIFGGLGVAREMPLERWYREMRIKRIGEGPSEVHRMVVARDLLGGRAGRRDMSIDFDVEDGIATITINRPERLNAMDAEHYRGLSQAWIRVRDDAAIRVAIVTGAGEKSFTAGADLKASSRRRRPRRDVADPEGSAAQPRARSVEAGDRGGERLLPRRRHDAAPRHRHPHRRRARDLQHRRGEARHPAGNGGTQRILDQLPYAIGMEMLLTGDSIDAPKALRYGLINKVVPKEKLMDDGARDGEEDRRERAARRAGREGDGGALARNGPHDGLRLRR